MRTLILALATVAFVYVNDAQGQDFKATLGKTFTAFDTTHDDQKKLEQSNKLSLIAKKWSDEPMAHYYAALSKIILSYTKGLDAAKRDAYLDEADKEYDDMMSAMSNKPNDETYVLAAFLANARLGVDGANRWQKYGKLFSENMEKAKEINPDNPRIYYLQGTSKRFTPKMFGGGKKAALPYFEKAEGLFAKESGDDILKPSWGKRMNTYFLNDCKSEDKD
jgi:hypothetical protein